MKHSYVFILIFLFFLSTVISVANTDTLRQQERGVSDETTSLTQDSLDLLRIQELGFQSKAYNDVSYLTWVSTSLFLPGITILGSELMPVDSVSPDPHLQNIYKTEYKKERREAAIYGTIGGLLMLLWWGVIIL